MPHADRKERTILGGLIDQFPETVPPTIALLLRHAPGSFDDERDGTIACAIYDLWLARKPINSVALSEYLEDKKLRIRAGGIPYLMELVQGALCMDTCEREAQDVWNEFQKRRSQVVAAEIANQIESNPDNAKTIIQAGAKTLSFLATEDENRKPKLTVRKPSEFLTMEFSDSDIILGDRLFAVGQSLVIAAAGGTGKSRFILQLIAAVVSGEKFLIFDTGGRKLRWLVLQTENSNRRLKDDMARISSSLNGTWPAFNEQVFIHTIENDIDSFVSLDNPENVAHIAALIEETYPDVVVADPLNDFGIGDLNKDPDMRATVMALSKVVRKTNPTRGIVALHHALTGKAGAQRTTGYDRASFARNSKALHAWTRGQINMAPVDPDSNDRLIIGCGKCSNGKEFLPFAVRMNPDTMIYECDPTVDIKAWESEMSGGKSNEATMTAEKVGELCSGPKTRLELVKLVMEDCGCSKATAYRHVFASAKSRKLKFNKDLGIYNRA